MSTKGATSSFRHLAFSPLPSFNSLTGHMSRRLSSYFSGFSLSLSKHEYIVYSNWSFDVAGYDSSPVGTIKYSDPDLSHLASGPGSANYLNDLRRGLIFLAFSPAHPVDPSLSLWTRVTISLTRSEASPVSTMQTEADCTSIPAAVPSLTLLGTKMYGIFLSSQRIGR